MIVNIKPSHADLEAKDGSQGGGLASCEAVAPLPVCKCAT